MSMMSYDRLQRVSHSTPPYRGTVNRFPLYTRRQNTKYFLVREEGGQTVFDIVYGQRWDTRRLSREQYMALSKREAERVERPGDNYVQYVSRPNIMGTVRKGDCERGEFQFNAQNYGQGERMFLTGLFRGWFITDSRRGGMLYRERATNVMYPIYRDMKVDVVTMKPLIPHEVVMLNVDRKKSKQLVKDYEHFFKVSEVMLKSITMEVALKTAQELRQEIGLTGSGLLKEAEDRINTAPLDAFILYAMAYNVSGLEYVNRWRYSGINSNIAYDHLFMSVKRRLTKSIYSENPDVFKELKYACGEVYPANDWGVSVLVNDKKVEQYK